MTDYTYIKTDMYTEEVHDFWKYILHNLSGISIIEETECYIHFLATENDYKHLQFLCDCDFGMMFEGTPKDTLENYVL